MRGLSCAYLFTEDCYMLKIVITDSETVGTDIHFGSFAEFGRVVRYDVTPPEKTAERIRDADVVLCNKTLLTKENMSTAPNLKYIGIFATGYNNVDLEYTNSRGITVTNVPGYSTEAVVQHTFALLLELFNHTAEYNALVQSGEWKKSKTFSMFPIPFSEICGKTIGIIGFGTIGRRVAETANAFGMKVLAYTRTLKNAPNVEFTSFEDLLARSDVVTVHCPLNSASEKMINKDTISKMKKGAYLINTARGPIVDEQALADALENGMLAGAGIDVLCKEPMENNCPLFGAKNCIITPHIAWAALETRQRLVGIVEDNLRSFIAGFPKNTVR